MASVKYTYSISTDFPNQKVASDRLTQEIGASAIVTALGYIETVGDDCDIWFKDALSSGDEAVLTGVVNAHTGEPLPSGPTKVQLEGFPDMGGWYYWRKGFRWEMVAGQTTIQDTKFDENLRLAGGGFHINGDAHDGDYIEFQIVDVDGVYYPAGTVLSTFISTEYVWPERQFDIMMEDAVLVYLGLYLRCKYVSTGSTDVVMRAWYHIRHIPS